MHKSSPSLLSIVAHARSGALDHAWRLFQEAGLEGVEDDAAVLSVRGRLFKDRGLAAVTLDERQGFYRQAAEAYGRAGAISGATYPLINAATLALLAGDAGQARRRAADVLARLDGGEAEPDTPYYTAATRAEALLLTGETGRAREALAEAMALAPRAWEDHASTLSQFSLILEALNEDIGWLDALRPPRSLHFAGHMAVAPDDVDVAGEVDAFLKRESIGFGFGALAAGADIIIAEALLAHGAELHLLLPAAVEAFRRASVAAQGEGWAMRFDAVLARAETVQTFGHPDDPQHPLAVRLAAEAAMGQALTHARTLASDAVQLLILEEADTVSAGGSAWMAHAWQAAGRRGQVIVAPRAGVTAAMPEAPAATLAAMLEVQIATDIDDSLASVRRHADTALSSLVRAIEEGPSPLAPPSWRGASVQLAFATPGDAAEAARRIVAALPESAACRIAGAYGLVLEGRAGGPRFLGPTAALPADILRSTPPGAVLVTELFAWAMQVGEARPPRAEYVGDLPGMDIETPVRLYTLKV